MRLPNGVKSLIAIVYNRIINSMIIHHHDVVENLETVQITFSALMMMMGCYTSYLSITLRAQGEYLN
jgi:hypothetical protein